MPFVKTFALGLAVVGAGLVTASADYAMQHSAADGAYDTRDYVRGLYDRFGETGGVVSLVLRKSAMVRPHLPPAPAGWEALPDWDTGHWTLYSHAQDAAIDAEFERMDLDGTLLYRLNRVDENLVDAYLSDTALNFVSNDGIVYFSVHDPDRRINNATYRTYEDLIDAHWDRVDSLTPFGDYQGVAWYEVEGPVERASDGSLRHDLRAFEARIGDIEITLATRVSAEGLEDFLDSIDLSGLKALSTIENAPAPQG